MYVLVLTLDHHKSKKRPYNKTRNASRDCMRRKREAQKTVKSGSTPGHYNQRLYIDEKV
jgi:hypothetical protein